MDLFISSEYNFCILHELYSDGPGKTRWLRSKRISRYVTRVIEDLEVKEYY